MPDSVSFTKVQFSSFNSPNASWTSVLLFGNFGNCFLLSLYIDIAAFFKTLGFNKLSSIFCSSLRITLDGRWEISPELWRTWTRSWRVSALWSLASWLWLFFVFTIASPLGSVVNEALIMRESYLINVMSSVTVVLTQWFCTIAAPTCGFRRAVYTMTRLTKRNRRHDSLKINDKNVKQNVNTPIICMILVSRFVQIIFADLI